MKTLLIVDDQPAIRKMLRIALEGHFTIEEAETADAAWEHIRIAPPAGVVLDVLMPGEINGIQLCKRIKSDATLQDIHVVLMTASGQVVPELARSFNADGFLPKPFSPFTLLRHLSSALLRQPDPAQEAR